MKFLKCEHCGNTVGVVEEVGVPMVCCGAEMQEIIPGTIEGSLEKHIPVVKVDGNKVVVEVGSVLHPMIEEHNIAWVALETKQGNQRKPLKDSPTTCFMICDDDAVVSAYAYCNLHGLWKSK